MSNSFQIFKDVLTNNYFNFSGRVNRPGYWHFILWSIIIWFALFVLDILLFGFNEDFNLLSDIWNLAIAIPSLGLAARRYHDTNRTGWWLFIPAIPLVPSFIFLGLELEVLFIIFLFLAILLGIWAFILLCLKGDPENNKYGPCTKKI
tara:strand:- start:307 stop:750 length:444 start_codon:yes stop_codon:yes gene_type:complete